LIDETTRVLVQGITGRDGSFHTQQMIEYGTQVVGGVTPGRGGRVTQGVPVLNTVREAVQETGANASVIFVPARRNAADAIVEADPQTQAIVLVGEIGGSDEEAGAEVIKTMKKPVVGFISGRTAPPGKRMGHAGAIISGTSGTPQAKVAALQAAGVPVADTTHDIPELVRQALARVRGAA